MSDLRRASSYPLEDAGTEQLERLLAVEEERVRAGLVRLKVPTPTCAVAFIWVEDDDEPLVGYSCAYLAEDRAKALDAYGEQAIWMLWSPADWSFDNFLDDPLPAAHELADEVAQHLHGAGCEHAQAAVLLDLAWRLSRADWGGVMPVTEDFACWATEHEVTEETLDGFRLTARPEAIEAFEKRDWLRFPDDFAL